MNTKIKLVLALIICSPVLHAQEFTIRQIETGGEQVTLHYNLVDTTKNRTYTIFVYSSKDNFSTPLTKLTGDAGLEVRPGVNKKIVWNVKEEFGPAYEGDVEMEVRGRVYVPFIRFEGFDKIQVQKRGVPFIVKWTGGNRQNILNFQLYNKDKLVHTFSNVANASEYKVVIPNSVKPRDGYYFRISDTRNADQVVVTPKFKVKRRIPLALKVLPIIAIGAAVPFLLPDPEPDIVESPSDPPSSTN